MNSATLVVLILGACLCMASAVPVDPDDAYSTALKIYNIIQGRKFTSTTCADPCILCSLFANNYMSENAEEEQYPLKAFAQRGKRDLTSCYNPCDVCHKAMAQRGK